MGRKAIIILVFILISLFSLRVLSQGGIIEFNPKDFTFKVNFNPPQLLTPCRHISHGVERWNGTGKWDKSSGFRTTSTGQAVYCASVQKSREQEHPERQVTLVDIHADHRRRNLGTVVEYNHHCYFEERWDPVYKLASSEVCPKKKWWELFF